MHRTTRFALLTATCAWIATPGLALAGNEPAPAPPAIAMCPATLPSQIDPEAWTGINLEHGSSTPLREVMWAPDQEQGSTGRVQCHYDSSDTGYWNHPVLTSVFKVRQPDPSAWPSWHPAYTGSDRWLCSGATDPNFETGHCQFELVDAVEATKTTDPRSSVRPF